MVDPFFYLRVTHGRRPFSPPSPLPLFLLGWKPFWGPFPSFFLSNIFCRKTPRSPLHSSPWPPPLLPFEVSVSPAFGFWFFFEFPTTSLRLFSTPFVFFQSPLLAFFTTFKQGTVNFARLSFPPSSQEPPPRFDLPLGFPPPGFARHFFSVTEIVNGMFLLPPLPLALSRHFSLIVPPFFPLFFFFLPYRIRCAV